MKTRSLLILITLVFNLTVSNGQASLSWAPAVSWKEQFLSSITGRLPLDLRIAFGYPAARVINGHGWLLTPALIDVHLHSSATNSPRGD